MFVVMTVVKGAGARTRACSDVVDAIWPHGGHCPDSFSFFNGLPFYRQTGRARARRISLRSLRKGQKKSEAVNTTRMSTPLAPAVLQTRETIGPRPLRREAFQRFFPRQSVQLILLTTLTDSISRSRSPPPPQSPFQGHASTQTLPTLSLLRLRR